MRRQDADPAAWPTPPRRSNMPGMGESAAPAPRRGSRVRERAELERNVAVTISDDGHGYGA